MVTWNHVTNWKYNISSSKRPIITKFCRVVTNDEGNSHTWLSDYKVTWGHVTNKRRNFFSCASLVTMETYVEGNSPMSHDLWPRGHMRTCDNSEIKYLLFCEADGHQSFESGNSWWGKLTHNVRWLSDHVTTWSRLTNWKLKSPLPQGLWTPNMVG